MAAAAAASQQKELLALMHQHLVQIGYGRAAKELLRQSGQKNFPSPSASLEDIFIQWKKTSTQAPKRKADGIKIDTPAKIRVPDPQSSSETSEEEEVANPIKTNLPANNSSVAKAESSTEDEDSSSEEEEVAGKMAKTNFLQLAAQKTNSVPGKGVAVAAVQAKERTSKASSNKPSPSVMAKAGQKKVLPGKPVAAASSRVLTRQSTAAGRAAQKAAASESSSSSSSESEEEKTSTTAVKTPTPKPAPKKTENSSEDSSEDSDSEEEAANAATVQAKSSEKTAPTSTASVKSVLPNQLSGKAASSPSKQTPKAPAASLVKPTLAKVAARVESSGSSGSSSESENEAPPVPVSQKVKPAVPGAQLRATPVKSSPAAVIPSKRSTVKASPAKAKVSQIRAGSGSAAESKKPADSSDTSDSSDSEEDKESSSAAQSKSEKTPPASTASGESALPNQLSGKAASSPSKQTPKPPAASLVKPTLAKVAARVESSGSSGSSSESENEAPPVPVSQKVKPAVPGAQLSATPVKSSPATVIPFKRSTVKASPAKAKVSQIRAGSGSAAESKKPADSSDTSDSSDSEEDKESSSAAQAKSSEKTPPASTASGKSAPPNQLSGKATCSPSKQAPKPPAASLVKPTLAKVAARVESSGSSESSSESENEAPPVPVSHKRLQTPQPPTGVKQNQAAKPGPPVKAPSSALKRTETESESSGSSDSEDETVPAAQNLPPPSATKASAAAQPTYAKKSHAPPTPLKTAQQSEDSSQDSSDESDSEEDTVFTQKAAPVTQKASVNLESVLDAKTTGAKAGSVQSAGKGAASLGNLAPASLQKAPESSETDSSDSSDSEENKPVKQPPIHPFFMQKMSSNKAAAPSGKDAQVLTAPSVSSKCGGKPPAVAKGKMELNSSPKAKPCQSKTPLAKPAGILKHRENLRSSSSSSNEEVATTATSKQIPQPGISQKQGVTEKADSSSEESSDEEQEPSQSLLAGYPGLLKPLTVTVQKSVAPKPTKQSSGKTAPTTGTPALSAVAKSSEKVGPADISSSDSSDSDSDAKETPAGPKAETGASLFSAKEAVVSKMSKGATMGKTAPDGVASKAAPAEKATAKSQKNGRAKGKEAVQSPLSPLPESLASERGDKAVAGAQGDTQVPPVVAGKTRKAAKPSKAGVKEKPKRKRKLAAGDTELGEPKRKKQKGKTGSEVVKKKKKSKSSSGTKALKEKDGKGKKSKKKSKKLPSDGSPLKKKKKKKKKTNDLEGAV